MLSYRHATAVLLPIETRMQRTWTAAQRPQAHDWCGYAAVRMIETQHKWAKPSVTNIDNLN